MSRKRKELSKLNLKNIPIEKARFFPLSTICPRCDSGNTHGYVDLTWNIVECLNCGYIWREKL